MTSKIKAVLRNCGNNSPDDMIISETCLHFKSAATVTWCAAVTEL